MDHTDWKLNRFGLNGMSTTAATFAARIWNETSTEHAEYSTNTGEDDVDEINRFSRRILTFAAVMTILIMIVGICGNMLTIIALLKCPKVRNVAAAFIISLCVADCIFCAIVLPFSASRFIQGTWTHGEFLCRLIPFLQYGNIGVSLLCIAMITINRYIMIAHHSMYAKIYKKLWIGVMIAFCWVFSYGMQLPTFLEVWGAFGYDSRLGTCSILKDSNGRSSKTALFIIAFLIPCLIIVGCYARIFWVVHKSEVRLRRHASKQNSIPNNLRSMPSTTGAGASRTELSSSSYEVTSAADAKYSNTSQKSIRVKDQRDVKARRNEWRITKMVLAIFLSFTACYLPITVIKVADPDVHMPTFHIIGYIMLYLSACINPIIYVIMNKQYRQAYKTVLLCKSTRLLPLKGSSLGEKWKDIGYSYNHSRTVVSQVSIADSNSTNQPITMREHTNNPIPGIDNSNNNNRQSWTATTDMTPSNQAITSNNNLVKPSNLQVSYQLDSEQRPYVPPRSVYPPPLDLNDVIIEEDETILDESDPKDIPDSIRGSDAAPTKVDNIKGSSDKK